ncbi:glycoside hydrolase family 19 protein [candidate division KSB1 bacterium]|nr:glycoside hydrolase family 19 protein [candidate division KSB1 bacterium]
MITDDSLRQIMPRLRSEKRAVYLPLLQRSMAEFKISTPRREAAFLAQIAHESGEFRWMEEIWGPTPQQLRYEPPSKLATNLGNTHTGDGKRFKGRGPIQITGLYNYDKYGNLLGINLLDHPEKAATPEVGFRIAGLFWQKNGLNELADRLHFELITRKINGGVNGLADRLKYYARAKQVLGIGGEREIEAETERDLPPSMPEFTRGREEIERSSAGPTDEEAKPKAKRASGKRTARKRTKKDDVTTEQ